MKSTLPCILGFLALIVAAPLASAEEHHDMPGKETHADHMLEGYAEVSAALSKDDLDTAKKAAAGMVKHDKDSAMATQCQAIADSKTLDEARTYFKELSALAIPIAKQKKTMTELHCPMAFDNKGGNWLQKLAEPVQNPYMGKKMADCGEVVK